MKKGMWIQPPEDMGDLAVGFRRDFSVGKQIKKATLWATAIGTYTLHLNGERVGRGVLAPGWTSYYHRIQYQTYDLTALLQASNTLEIRVGNGWARSVMGWIKNNTPFSERPCAIAWMEILYTDGTREELRSDESWQVYTTDVLFTRIYHGETVDKTAPIRLIGNAIPAKIRRIKLVPQVGEWIVEVERLAPVEVIRTPKGELVLDFGQNMTGYVEVTIQGKRGDKIVMHHAEVLDSEGNFYNDNFRSARNENTYILSGERDVFKPSFTFQGFRYIRLTEYPFDEVDPNCFRAIVVHSEMTRTGRFICGNEKINQLYHNVVWGQKSNYLDIPTDCPQRDERLGWTGDAQVFCRTAAINYDIERFFRKWLGDVALEQTRDGAVYGVIPSPFLTEKGEPHGTYVSAAWGDVACIVPWELYLAYGNRNLLRENFPMMKKWVEYMHHFGSEEFLWLGATHYGDWLAMDNDPDRVDGATPTDLIASAFFAYSTDLLIRAGEVLGEDMTEYRTLYQNVVKAFRARYIRNGKLYPVANGETDVLARETQTAYVLILAFGLYEGDDERRAFSARLAEMIRENGDRMTTGFVGTPYILHVLSENGYTDLAYALLMQEKNPSWLYSVCHGATTMWEHWNSLKEDGSFWSTSMNSFNHYAYGAVFDWIFGVCCGIKTVESAPAYKEITLEPHPNRVLGFADTSIDTRNGHLRAHWYYKGDVVYYEFEIPCGMTAHLRLPSGYTATLHGGIYHFAE